MDCKEVDMTAYLMVLIEVDGWVYGKAASRVDLLEPEMVVEKVPWWVALLADQSGQLMVAL